MRPGRAQPAADLGAAVAFDYTLSERPLKETMRRMQLLNSVVLLVLAQAERAFSAELLRINIEALAQSGRELQSSAAAE